MAIFFAGGITKWQECVKDRGARRSWIAQIKILANMVDDMADNVSATWVALPTGSRTMESKDKYKPLQETIGAFPMPKDGDESHFRDLLYLKDVAGEWNWRWVTAVEHAEEIAMGPGFDELDKLKFQQLVESTRDLIAKVKCYR